MQCQPRRGFLTQHVMCHSEMELNLRRLLRRMIANRVQEEAFGTLDRATLKFLDGLARRGGFRPAERNLKIGTVLVRDYQGRRHTVTVAPDGYVWEGQPYSSLSAIARAITGTAWSGPRFFALKSSTPTERPEAAHRPASPPTSPSGPPPPTPPPQSSARRAQPRPVIQQARSPRPNSSDPQE